MQEMVDIPGSPQHEWQCRFCLEEGKMEDRPEMLLEPGLGKVDFKRLLALQTLGLLGMFILKLLKPIQVPPVLSGILSEVLLVSGVMGRTEVVSE